VRGKLRDQRLCQCCLAETRITAQDEETARVQHCGFERIEDPPLLLTEPQSREVS